MILNEQFNPNFNSLPITGKYVNEPQIIKVLIEKFNLDSNDILSKLISLNLLKFKSLSPTNFSLSNNYFTEKNSFTVGIINTEITPIGIKFFEDSLKNYSNIIIKNIIDKAILHNQKTLILSDPFLNSEKEQIEFVYSEHKTDPDFISKFIDEIKKRDLLSLFEIFNFNSELKSIYQKSELENNLNKNYDTNSNPNSNANTQDIKKLKI